MVWPRKKVSSQDARAVRASRHSEHDRVAAVEEAGVAALRPVRLSREVPLGAPGEGWRRVGQSLTDDGDVVVVWSEGGFAQEELARQDGSVMQWECRTGELSDLVVDLYSLGSRHRRRHITSSGARYPKVDLLPGDRLVVVDGRCSPSDAGELPQNAVVYGPDDVMHRAFHVGDGIETVQCTPSGWIWVGYFDEGIFGNDRWREITGQWPPSATGLARFDEYGRLDWSLTDQSATGSVADIYALNLVGETAWACPYTDFPVVRIDDGDTESWRTDVSGASALLIAGDSVALVGGYGASGHSRVVVGSLADAVVNRVSTRWLETADGDALPQNAITLGRGANLVVLTDSGYATLALADLLG